MKISKIFLLLLVALAVTSCSSRDKDMEKIREMEKQVFTGPSGMDNEKAKALILLYEEFAGSHSGDSLAPACLYKAAELSINLNDGEGAIRFFDRVINEYPDYSKVPEACFLKAFVYEVTFQNINKAGDAYKDFLRKYPDHDLADDAQASINNLGKTPDQIILEAQKAAARAREDSLASAGSQKKN
jgi:outer membrane protein assembly factor BamD (BamD/ComL family)